MVDEKSTFTLHLEELGKRLMFVIYAFRLCLTAGQG